MCSEPSDGLLELALRTPRRPWAAFVLDDRRCKPALSRSESSQERTVARMLSISNRFESPRGVFKNDMRTFVTSRLQRITHQTISRKETASLPVHIVVSRVLV